MQRSTLKSFICCSLLFTYPSLEALAATATPPANPPPQEQGEKAPISPARGVIMDAALQEQLKKLREQKQLHPTPDMIQKLNARYQDTRDVCDDGTSVLGCTGLRIRRASEPLFWINKPTTKALKSVTFTFLRAGNPLSNKTKYAISSGYILMDDATARQARKHMPPARCIYPKMANTLGVARYLHGCGLEVKAGETVAPRDDESACQTLSPSVTTADDWLEDFKKRGSQCSLSAGVPEQVMTALEARAGMGTDAEEWPIELLLKTWHEDEPITLPIEAFFFKASDARGFDSALIMRESFYKATGQMVPVVKLDYSEPTGNIVKALSDAEEGRLVSNTLNARYNAKDLPDCTGKPWMYCSGVTLRTTTFGENFRAWNPSATSVAKQTVSFSVLRSGDGIKHLAWNNLYQGLIFKPLNSVNEPGMYPLKPLCIYPTDAGTWGRVDQGCGTYGGDQLSRPCAAQGVTTAAGFKQNFQRVGDDGTQWNMRNQLQCSLAITPAGLLLNTQVRQNATLNAQQYIYHNEMMIEAWPQDIPELLPLEAFFWIAGNASSGQTQAMNMQRDLMKSGKFVPVIRLNLSAAAGGVFVYAPEDQACTPTACK